MAWNLVYIGKLLYELLKNFKWAVWKKKIDTLKVFYGVQVFSTSVWCFWGWHSPMKWILSTLHLNKLHLKIIFCELGQPWGATCIRSKKINTVLKRVSIWRMTKSYNKVTLQLDTVWPWKRSFIAPVEISMKLEPRPLNLYFIG